MSSANTSTMPNFAPAPPGPERFFDTADEAFPIELTEECADDEEPEPEEPGPVIVWDRDRDWYLDTTEEHWLTAKHVQERFPASRPSTFNLDVVHRNAFGLRTARRKAWKSNGKTSTERRKVFEYPLWRVRAYLDRIDTTAIADAAERDRGEQQWLNATAVQEQFGLHYTSFQHAVSRDKAGLRTTRRITIVNHPRTWRGQVFEYPLWRVEMWAHVPALTRPIPTIDEVKRLRSEQDSAASLLAREVGFSPVEVRAAAAIGDLGAGIDPNTSKVLFLPPRATEQWLHRDGWRRTG